MDPLALVHAAGFDDAAPRVRLSGGDICRVERVGEVVVKSLPGAPAGFFEAEAAGLRRLELAGAPVPSVHHVASDGIVLAWVPPGRPDWPGLGRALAALHGREEEAYGRVGPCFLGRVPLPSGTSTDWTEHLVEGRLRPLLSLAEGTLGAGLSGRVRRRLDGLRLDVEGPCLVHGDLWSGNLVHGVDGGVLIDPSAQTAERAYDLAMMRLFGGFPEEFWRAYQAAYPITAAARANLGACSMVFVLVHVVLFGASYVGAVERWLAE